MQLIERSEHVIESIRRARCLSQGGARANAKADKTESCGENQILLDVHIFLQGPEFLSLIRTRIPEITTTTRRIMPPRVDNAP